MFICIFGFSNNKPLFVISIFKRERKHSRRHYKKFKNLRQITGKRHVHFPSITLLAPTVSDIKKKLNFFFFKWFPVRQVSWWSSCFSNWILFFLFRDFGKTFAVGLNISKVFNRVWHKSVISKQPSYGLYPSLYTFISSFLSDHYIAAVVDGHCSSPKTINSGIPQDSVLSPTLFLLFINDRASVVQLLASLITNQLAWVRSRTKAGGTQLTQLFILPNGLVDKWVPRVRWGR